jgi:pilus assembly protein Flp/PilA
MAASMNTLLAKAMRDRRGATAIEYGLIAALIVVAAMAGIKSVGLNVTGLWQNSADRISAVIS